jgi:NAD(P)-dependent dehydrogenase (short-subunit alcohol dehydrogenase family)
MVAPHLSPGALALVTGAAGGIGRALAVVLARRGVRLALLDIDVNALGRVAEDVRAVGVDAIALEVDVSEPDDLDRAMAAVDRWGGPVHLAAPFAGLLTTFNTDQPDLRPLVEAVNHDHPLVVAERTLERAAAAGEPCHVVFSGSISGVERIRTDPYSISKVRLHRSARSVDHRARVLRRRTGRWYGTTLAVISPTATRFGASSLAVYRRRRPTTDDLDDLIQVDGFLLREGMGPSVVADRIIEGVERRQRTVYVTPGSGVRSRVLGEVVVPVVDRRRRAAALSDR